MPVLTDFAGQNWLITPAALAVGEFPPASIRDQKFLLILSGVVFANLEGNSGSQWLHETVSFLPDMAGPQNSGPLNWAIGRFGIPRPPGQNVTVGFSLEEWAPFASLSSIFNQDQSINSGFAVDAWRPTHFQNGIDAVTFQPVGNLFAGVDVDVAVRDTDAWIFRLGYNIALLGKIVFLTVPKTLFQSDFNLTAANTPPATTQAVGTAQIDGPRGSVLAFDPPFPHTERWMRISRPPTTADRASFEGLLTETPGDGVYSFSAAVVIPSGGDLNAILSISFETLSQEFLHIDFVQDGSVRVDDTTTFGTFHHDQVFLVQVVLNVSGGASTAVVLLTGGAGGQLNYTLTGVNQTLSRQFGAIRVWQGFNDFGVSFVTDVVVALQS